mmetsp:Transcript_103959/g.325300  ORF Transcript_103959/g.325300 Transcript_103959/m.325300 type:complete len:215 (-) Transcript_103959:15-659(-)
MLASTLPAAICNHDFCPQVECVASAVEHGLFEQCVPCSYGGLLVGVSHGDCTDCRPSVAHPLGRLEVQVLHSSHIEPKRAVHLHDHVIRVLGGEAREPHRDGLPAPPRRGPPAGAALPSWGRPRRPRPLGRRPGRQRRLPVFRGLLDVFSRLHRDVEVVGILLPPGLPVVVRGSLAAVAAFAWHREHAAGAAPARCGTCQGPHLWLHAGPRKRA